MKLNILNYRTDQELIWKQKKKLSCLKKKIYKSDEEKQEKVKEGENAKNEKYVLTDKDWWGKGEVGLQNYRSHTTHLFLPGTLARVQVSINHHWIQLINKPSQYHVQQPVLPACIRIKFAP